MLLGSVRAKSGAGTSRQRASRCLHPCRLSRTSGLDCRLVRATESFAANRRRTRQYHEPHRGGRIGQRGCCDCTTAQWSGKSAIENSPASTRATAACGRDRVSQELPLKDNAQLYPGRQASQIGLIRSDTFQSRSFSPFGNIARATSTVSQNSRKSFIFPFSAMSRPP